MGKLFLLAGMAGLCWRPAIAEPDVPQIVQHSAEEVTADWNRAPDYSFVEHDVQSKHDASPSVKTYQVLQIDGSPYNRLMALGDQPISAGQQAEEERKLRNEIQKRQKESERDRAKRVDKYVKERHQDWMLMNGMMEAFDFRLAGQETMDGRDCWLLDANPKPGYQPPNRELKVLAGMRGRLWIDKATGHWVKVQAQVFQTVSFYGLLSTHVSASALGLFNEDSVDDETYSNYEPMPQTLSRLGSR